MKRAMKVIFVILFCALSVCSSTALTVPRGMTPEETVKYYFSQFSDRSQFGMDSVVCKKMQGADYDLGSLVYVKLISSVEDKNDPNISFDTDWYPNAYKVTLVNVTYDIKYLTGDGGGQSNGRYEWQYYLAKDSAKSDWVIVQWGVC